MEKMYEFPSNGFGAFLQEMDLWEGSEHVWLLYGFNLAIHPSVQLCGKKISHKMESGNALQNTETHCLREQPANKQQEFIQTGCL